MSQSVRARPSTLLTSNRFSFTPMKTLLIVATAAALVATHAQVGLGQPAGAPATAPVAPVAPGTPVPSAPLPPSAPKAPENSDLENVIQDVHRAATETVRTTLKATQAAVAQAGQAGGKGLDSNLYHFGGGARSSSRSLAVLTTSADSPRVDSLEEDLSVMGRILQKAARSLRDDERYSALGLDLEASVFGSASGARNLYIEGYGALFLLSVKYPLVGPREPVDATVPPAPSTEWESTLNELRGGNRNYGEPDASITIRSTRARLEPFDPTLVDGLKTALIDALKNASNIRDLRPEEIITVVVQGGETLETRPTAPSGTPSPAAGSNRSETRVRKEGKYAGETVTIKKSTQQTGETVMTVRVKKSDVDDFASGKISRDQFQGKTTIQTYLRRDELLPRSAKR